MRILLISLYCWISANVIVPGIHLRFPSVSTKVVLDILIPISWATGSYVRSRDWTKEFKRFSIQTVPRSPNQLSQWHQKRHHFPSEDNIIDRTIKLDKLTQTHLIIPNFLTFSRASGTLICVRSYNPSHRPTPCHHARDFNPRTRKGSRSITGPDGLLRLGVISALFLVGGNQSKDLTLAISAWSVAKALGWHTAGIYDYRVRLCSSACI